MESTNFTFWWLNNSLETIRRDVVKLTGRGRARYICHTFRTRGRLLRENVWYQYQIRRSRQNSPPGVQESHVSVELEKTLRWNSINELEKLLYIRRSIFLLQVIGFGNLQQAIIIAAGLLVKFACRLITYWIEIFSHGAFWPALVLKDRLRIEAHVA